MTLNLLVNPFIALNMAPEDYAIVGFYSSFSSLLVPIILFYLVHYYIKEYFRRSNQERLRLKALIAKALIVFSGVASLVCFLLLLFYLKFVRTDFNLPIIPYLALTVFALPMTGLLSLELAQCRMERKATAYFWLSTVNGVLSVLCSVIFVVLIKWGAFGKLFGLLLCNMIVFAYLAVRYKDLFKINNTFKEYKTVFVFCLPLAMSATLGYFNNGFGTTCLESLGQTEKYGIYIVGITIGTYLSTFSSAVNATFQPDLYESIAKKWWRRYIKICLTQILIIALIVLTFILLAPYVIALLTANRYVASTPYAQIMSITALTSSVYFIINNFSIATDHPKLYLLTTIIGSLAIICLMPVAINKYEFVGGVWMTVISYVIFTIINIFLLILVKYKNKYMITC